MFKQIENDSNGKLDLLVNNCYAAVGRILGAVDNPIDKFWECDPLMWDEFNDVGLRIWVDQLSIDFLSKYGLCNPIGELIMLLLYMPLE